MSKSDIRTAPNDTAPARRALTAGAWSSPAAVGTGFVSAPGRIVFHVVHAPTEAVHRRLLNSSIEKSDMRQVGRSLTLGSSATCVSANSSDSIRSLCAGSYRSIRMQLRQLAEEEDEDEMVERGAIDSALALSWELQCKDYAPPMISWHGGDAVVMLWSLGGMTYAITITDGEIGYVVREGKKSLRSEHSISIEKFLLEDLR